jgi:hypothetical protein
MTLKRITQLTTPLKLSDVFVGIPCYTNSFLQWAMLSRLRILWRS